MVFPEAEQFVFLVITWGEDEREAFGPFVAHQDGSHLEEVTDRVKEWRTEHSDRPGMAAHLFATTPVAPEDDTPDLETVP